MRKATLDIEELFPSKFSGDDMERKFRGICLLFLFFLLTACSYTPQKRLIEHKKPDLLTIDNSYFEDLNCFDLTPCKSAIPQELDFRVFSIEQPSEFLGGLVPSIPLVEALTYDFEHNPNIPSVYSGRCAATEYVNYLVFMDGKVQMLDSKQKFAEVFAPIESKEEALSYAVAVTGYSPMYDLESIEGLEIVSRKVEETYVKKIKGGYIVHLFDYFLCHCGPFVIKSVDVTVYVDGSISISDKADAYHDPRWDNVCID